MIKTQRKINDEVEALDRIRLAGRLQMYIQVRTDATAVTGVCCGNGKKPPGAALLGLVVEMDWINTRTR